MSQVSLAKICNGGDELRNLEASLVNVGNEVKHTVLKDSDIFNKVACGEPIDCALKFEKSRRIVPNCKHFFMGNHLPHWERGSDAQARRIKILNFPIDFTAKAKNKLFEETVKGENAGIFNWMLEGLAKVWTMEQMPNGSKQSQRSSWEFKKNNNPLGEFIKETHAFDPAGYVVADDFAKGFREWCDRENITTYMMGAGLYRCLYSNYPQLSSDRIYVGSKQTRIIRGIKLS